MSGNLTDLDQSHELELEFKGSSRVDEVHTSFSSSGVLVQYSCLKLPAEYDFKWDGSSHYLAYHDLILLDGEMEVLGEKPSTGRDIRDQITFVPAGQTIQGWAKPADRLNAFTVVCFDPAAMEEELQAEFDGFEALPNIYFKDEILGATMRKLGRMMSEQDKPASKIYAETLGLTAALEMHRLTVENSQKTHISGSGQLSRPQSDLLHSYIEEHLASDIGLDELAALVGLTRFHFSRAFKATYGTPPYQYLNQRRIEKARRLLVATKLPVAGIAAACGFNGASQFGRAFRSAVGATPLAYRRSA
jgi:AraC family transcriptional regulator